MATDKPIKRKRKGSADNRGSAGQAGSAPGRGAQGERYFLRQRSDPRTERRFQPRGTPAVIITMLGGSLAALAVGAGVYGQFFLDNEHGPHGYAPYLLAAGIVAFAAVLLFGQWGTLLRVGDAGLAVEKGAGEFDRIAWCDVTRIQVLHGALLVQAAGTSITIPVAVYPQAAAHALAEARARLPALAGAIEEGSIPKPDSGAGEILPLDLPQVAGQRCKSSDRLITFEADARLCGRCGELYHKDSVPRRCATCDAPLRA